MGDITFSSTLAVPADTLWRHAVSPASMNREFFPWLRMTFPGGITDLTAGARPDKRQFRSWLLVLGCLPLDYDDVVFDEVEPGHRFLERSTLMSQRVWQHERIVEPVAGGARMIDRVHYEARLTWLEPIYRPIFSAVFAWRHRRLRRIFGTLEDGSADASA